MSYDPKVNGERTAEFEDRIQREGRAEEYLIIVNALVSEGTDEFLAKNEVRKHHSFLPPELGKEPERQTKSMKAKIDDVIGRPIIQDHIKSFSSKAKKAKAEPENDEDVVTTRKGTMAESVEWVFHALGEEDVKPKEAPSTGALALYRWASERINKTEFYKTFAAKLMPSKTEIDQSMKFRDDGRKIMGHLDALEQNMELEDEPDHWYSEEYSENEYSTGEPGSLSVHSSGSEVSQEQY